MMLEWQKCAERLKQLRHNAGLSTRALTEKLVSTYGINISEASLKNYEVNDEFNSKAGKITGMKIEYLSCLADFYNVSTDYLLGKTDTASRNESVQGMREYTKLTEEAIEELHRVPYLPPLLNYILCGEEWEPFLLHLWNYLRTCKTIKKRTNGSLSALSNDLRRNNMASAFDGLIAISMTIVNDKKNEKLSRFDAAEAFSAALNAEHSSMAAFFDEAVQFIEDADLEFGSDMEQEYSDCQPESE